MSRWHVGETDYPAIRRVMGSERERYDDEALEELLERTFPSAEPEEVENFMNTLQQFGRQAAPILQKVGPGMAQGAMQGSALGPWGMLAGAVGGGAASLLGGGGPGAAPTPTAPVAARTAPVAAAPPMAMPPTSGAMPAPAAAAPAQLLALLSRPETMQALLSMAMGQLGRGTITMGQHQVPVPAFANAVAELASEAAHSVTRGRDDGSGYWYDPHGAPRCDVVNPAARAALLWSDLVETIQEEEWEGEGEWEEDEEGEEQFVTESMLDHYEVSLDGARFHDY